MLNLIFHLIKYEHVSLFSDNKRKSLYLIDKDSSVP